MTQVLDESLGRVFVVDLSWESGGGVSGTMRAGRMGLCARQGKQRQKGRDLTEGENPGRGLPASRVLGD